MIFGMNRLHQDNLWTAMICYQFRRSPLYAGTVLSSGPSLSLTEKCVRLRYKQSMGYEEFDSYRTKLHSQRTELEQLQSCTMVHPLHWQGILKHKGRWSRNRACHCLSWCNSMFISLHKTNFQNEASVFTAIIKYYSIVGEFNDAAQFLLRF